MPTPVNFSTVLQSLAQLPTVPVSNKQPGTVLNNELKSEDPIIIDAVSIYCPNCKKTLHRRYLKNHRSSGACDRERERITK